MWTNGAEHGRRVALTALRRATPAATTRDLDPIAATTASIAQNLPA
jgi:hypothetical protein